MRYLIPIAGEDTLFPPEEFHFPKPLVEIRGVPMIGVVIANIRARDPGAKFVFVVREADCREFSLDVSLKMLAGPDTIVVPLRRPTKGAVCSALLAIDHIYDHEPIILFNGDQIIRADLSDFERCLVAGDFDAGVVTFESVHPRWSYVRVDEEGLVAEAAEKRVVSRNAIAGYYFFKSGRIFVEAAKTYLLKSNPLSAPFYISACLNEIILGGGRIGTVAIDPSDYISFYSPQRVDYYLAQHERDEVEGISLKPSQLQVVVPMAGLGSRFSKAGYAKPKPFIDVAGKAMIARVMDNLTVDDCRFILIAQQKHLDVEQDLSKELADIYPLVFSPIDYVTEGAACTVLTARVHFDPNAPLLIANCDQIVDFDCREFIRDAQARGLDGSILVFKNDARDPKWSFAAVDAAGIVTEVKEKIAISDLATVGLYYFRSAGDFINATADMMARNDRTNGEFYVCPVYNYLIAAGGRVGVFEIPQNAMHGIGTPEDLDDYLELIV